MSLASMLLISAAMTAAPELPSLLEVLAGEETRKDALGACHYVERSRVEQLDSKGKVEGFVEREYAVVVTPTSLKRTLLKEKREGDMNSKLAALPKDQTAEERVASRLPFHPALQKQFRFTSAAQSEDRVAISFEPLEAHEKRIKGKAIVDARTKQLVSLSGSPSKLSMLVDEVKFDIDFAPTPCGVTLVRARTKGSGGALFLKIHFRIESELRDFKLAKPN